MAVWGLTCAFSDIWMWHPAEYLGLHCHTGKMSYGEQGNLLESKMSRTVSVGSLPETTPFSNSRALMSQFSHLTPKETRPGRSSAWSKVTQLFSGKARTRNLVSWSSGKTHSLNRDSRQVFDCLLVGLYHLIMAVKTLCWEGFWGPIFTHSEVLWFIAWSDLGMGERIAGFFVCLQLLYHAVFWFLKQVLEFLLRPFIF